MLWDLVEAIMLRGSTAKGPGMYQRFNVLKGRWELFDELPFASSRLELGEDDCEEACNRNVAVWLGGICNMTPKSVIGDG